MSDMPPPPETKQELPPVILGTCYRAGDDDTSQDWIVSRMLIGTEPEELKKFPRNIILKTVVVMLLDDYERLCDQAKGQP